MKVHRSNRMEVLIDALADELRAPLHSPFAREQVIVHSLGMERWLSQQLALRLGVASNLDFPFPGRAIRDLLRTSAGDTPDPDPWDMGRLTWRILSALPPMLEQPAFAPILRYLRDPSSLSGGRGFALARRIADAFARYPLYRPDWILSWEAGQSDDWQAELWRALARPEHPHLVTLTQRFIEKIASNTDCPLPERLSLFGISTLAPLHLQILQAVSTRIPVHLYVLSPSQEYWGDLQSRRSLLRAASKSGQALELASAGLAEGLLTSTGRLGRDFQALLESECVYQDGTVDFRTPGNDSVLHSLQTSVIHFHAFSHPESDQSLQVHSCHGPTRQVEVLHDLLLDRFLSDPSLQPRDVIIMTPSLEVYGPLVEAVFGRAANTPRFIPFRIADRSTASSHPTIAAFLKLLEGIGQRTTASLLYDRLSTTATSARFALESDELTRIREWLLASGVRWGLNADERAAHHQPAIREHTWEFGLDRLLSGFAVGPSPREVLGDVWPYTDLEGADGETLGKLLSFVEKYHRNAEQLSATATPSEWRNRLLQCAEDWIADPEGHEGGLQRLRDAVQEWWEEIEDSTLVLDLSAVRESLKLRLDRPSGGTAFLSGPATLCAMVPMRSVPFRVVVLLGMDEQNFPRRAVRTPFDRSQDEPRLGDRNPRDDDRYTFLESLLSARDALYILYTGRDPHTNDLRGPSPVVSELLECLPQPLRTEVHIEHPIQSFSPSNFTGVQAGFDPISAAGAQALSNTSKVDPPKFFSQPLPPLSGRVSLDTFRKVLSDPAKELLKTRLQMALADDTPGLEDREPLKLDGLASYSVRADLVGHLLTGRTPTEAKIAIRGSGSLPPGNAGNEVLDQELQRALSYVEAVLRCRGGTELPPLSVDLPFERLRLVGRLNERYPSGLVRGTPSSLRGKRLLYAWVDHLIANVGSDPTATWMVFSSSGEAVVRQFVPIPYAHALLSDLVALFEEATANVVPFDAQRSESFIRQVRAQKNRNGFEDIAAAVKAMNQQENAIETKQLSTASKSVQRLLGHLVTWKKDLQDYEAKPGTPFYDTAKRVFEPLLDHLKTP